MEVEGPEERRPAGIRSRRRGRGGTVAEEEEEPAEQPTERSSSLVSSGMTGGRRTAGTGHRGPIVMRPMIRRPDASSGGGGTAFLLLLLLAAAAASTIGTEDAAGAAGWGAAAAAAAAATSEESFTITTTTTAGAGPEAVRRRTRRQRARSVEEVGPVGFVGAPPPLRSTSRKAQEVTIPGGLDDEAAPDLDGCPPDPPIGGGGATASSPASCSSVGLRCEYGTETCCGTSHPELVCTCAGAGAGGGGGGEDDSGPAFVCTYTDACMDPKCSTATTTSSSSSPGPVPASSPEEEELGVGSMPGGEVTVAGGGAVDGTTAPDAADATDGGTTAADPPPASFAPFVPGASTTGHDDSAGGDGEDVLLGNDFSMEFAMTGTGTASTTSTTDPSTTSSSSGGTDATSTSGSGSSPTGKTPTRTDGSDDCPRTVRTLFDDDTGSYGNMFNVRLPVPTFGVDGDGGDGDNDDSAPSPTSSASSSDLQGKSSGGGDGNSTNATEVPDGPPSNFTTNSTGSSSSSVSSGGNLTTTTAASAGDGSFDSKLLQAQPSAAAPPTNDQPITVTITGMSIYVDIAKEVTYEIYSHAGDFRDATDDLTVWTPVASGTVWGRGRGVPTPIPSWGTSTVGMSPGNTRGMVAFYVTLTSPDLRYSNPDGSHEVGDVYATSDDGLVEIEAGVGVAEYPLGTTFYGPRIWNGELTYKVDGLPCPTDMPSASPTSVPTFSPTPSPTVGPTTARPTDAPVVTMVNTEVVYGFAIARDPTKVTQWDLYGTVDEGVGGAVEDLLRSDDVLGTMVDGHDLELTGTYSEVAQLVGDGLEGECDLPDAAHVCTAINAIVTLTHRPTLESEAVAAELLRHTRTVTDSLGLTTSYVGDEATETRVVITLRGVQGREMTPAEVEHFEGATRDFFNHVFEGEVDPVTGEPLKVLTVRVDDQEVVGGTTATAGGAGTGTTADGGAAAGANIPGRRRRRDLQSSSKTSVSITTSITGECRRCGNEFGTKVDDAIDAEPEKLKEELGKPRPTKVADDGAGGAVVAPPAFFEDIEEIEAEPVPPQVQTENSPGGLSTGTVLIIAGSVVGVVCLLAGYLVVRRSLKSKGGNSMSSLITQEKNARPYQPADDDKGGLVYDRYNMCLTREGSQSYMGKSGTSLNMSVVGDEFADNESADRAAGLALAQMKLDQLDKDEARVSAEEEESGAALGGRSRSTRRRMKVDSVVRGEEATSLTDRKVREAQAYYQKMRQGQGPSHGTSPTNSTRSMSDVSSGSGGGHQRVSIRNLEGGYEGAAAAAGSRRPLPQQAPAGGGTRRPSRASLRAQAMQQQGRSTRVHMSDAEADYEQRLVAKSSRW